MRLKVFLQNTIDDLELMVEELTYSHRNTDINLNNCIAPLVEAIDNMTDVINDMEDESIDLD